MEELFQEYGDRVNFVWVYGNEAHPEEDPFMEGYESADLGWTHPYSISHTMEVRAERAAWMKSDPDPDFEIPMLVDFVGHATEPDDAIREQYFGYGYYSGYVIDCDGIVKKAHDWGWFGPGGDWWGLPLAPVQGLRDWLDAYLAAPPPCYDTGEPPGPDAGVDAGVDGGTGPDPDAAVGQDAAVDDGAGDSGGCSTAATGGLPPVGLPLLLLLLAVRRRRR